MEGHHLRLALLDSALCWPDIENHSRWFWSMHSGRTQQSSTPVRNSTLTLSRLPLSQPMGTSLADVPEQLVLDATWLSAGGQADRFEAIIGRKPLSHVHSSTGGSSGRLSPSTAVNQWPSLLQAFTQSDAVSSHSATVTQDGGVTFSQQQSLRGQPLQSNQNHPLFSQIQILRPPIRIILSLQSTNQNHPLSPVHQSESSSLSSPPIRIILSLQSTNQNHPLSLSSYWPLMWGVWVVKMKGGAVNSCNRPLWSSGHSPLVAHTRHLARTHSARNQHRFHPDRYCWGFRSSQTEASRKLTPYTLALSGHSRLGQRWNCRLTGEHSPSRE